MFVRESIMSADRSNEKMRISGGEVPKSASQTLECLPADLHLTVGGLAELLGISGSVVRDRLSRGLLKPSGRNRLPVVENVRLYCDELRLAAGRHGAGHRDPAKVRLTEAQAATAELKLLRLRGELLAVAEVERAWSDVLRQVRAGVLAAPSRIGARLGLSATDVEAVAAELRDVLDALADDAADADAPTADAAALIEALV